jgi:CO/xanthine dehydrogenase Mo-binding subunit
VNAAEIVANVEVRLANDRFDQFQTSLKRHQFSMSYTAAVERRTGLLQSFRASIVANGGGRANCSVELTMAGATSAQSIYYFPKSDIAATAIASRAIDCGPARGYGALETLTATELTIDEIAGELGLDPIEFRLRNVLKTGMKTTQGAIGANTYRDRLRRHRNLGRCEFGSCRPPGCGRSGALSRQGDGSQSRRAFDAFGRTAVDAAARRPFLDG